MQAIIDNRKYNTDTAELIFSEKRNDYIIFNLYCNTKKAFFAHIIESTETDEVISEKIIKLSKQEAISCLIRNNAVEEYEKLFGEIPEAEGEDFITSANPVLNADILIVEPEEVAVVKSTEEKIEIKKKPKANILMSLKLCIACALNDYDKAQNAIVKKADVNFNHSFSLKKAVLNENKDIVNLLIDNGAFVIDYCLQQAVLIGNTTLFSILFEKALNPDIEKLLKLCEKYNKIYIGSYLNQFLKENEYENKSV